MVALLPVKVLLLMVRKPRLIMPEPLKNTPLAIVRLETLTVLLAFTLNTGNRLSILLDPLTVTPLAGPVIVRSPLISSNALLSVMVLFAGSEKLIKSALLAALVS